MNIKNGRWSIYVYNILEKKISYVLSEPKDDITAIDFSPNSKFIAVSSGDKLVYMYKNDSLISKLSGHEDWIRDVSFSNDGTRLISCGDDGKVVLWNIADIYKARKYNTKRHGTSWILSCDIHNDSKSYAYGNFKGKIEIVGGFGSYKANCKSPVNKVLFKPNEGSYLKVAVATRGNGVLFYNAIDMKSEH